MHKLSQKSLITTSNVFKGNIVLNDSTLLELVKKFLFIPCSSYTVSEEFVWKCIATDFKQTYGNMLDFTNIDFNPKILKDRWEYLKNEILVIYKSKNFPALPNKLRDNITSICEVLEDKIKVMPPNDMISVRQLILKEILKINRLPRIQQLKLESEIMQLMSHDGEQSNETIDQKRIAQVCENFMKKNVFKDENFKENTKVEMETRLLRTNVNGALSTSNFMSTEESEYMSHKKYYEKAYELTFEVPIAQKRGYDDIWDNTKPSLSERIEDYLKAKAETRSLLLKTEY